MGLMIAISLVAAFSVSGAFRNDFVAGVAGLTAMAMVPMLPVCLGLSYLGSSMIEDGALQYAAFYYFSVIVVPLVIIAAFVAYFRLEPPDTGLWFMVFLGMCFASLIALIMSVMALIILPLKADNFPVEGVHGQTDYVSYPELTFPLTLSSILVVIGAFFVAGLILRALDEGKPEEPKTYEDPFAHRTP